IHPILSEVKEDLKVINGQEFPLANSATRESDTVARVRNGEVIVISGLMQTRASGSNTSIPGVNEVPVLGSMLAQKRRETVKTELVILLRALVDQDTVMAEMLDETAERFDQMRRKIDPYYRGDME
ncbi:MAG: pilus (MSHA type) biogenesis protein MshL, partial [Gammaproteobacteria bacterium]|nr:pilus (MSHA type) biogenesis protein MshL [Gammaproteobacteria bacterium]